MQTTKKIPAKIVDTSKVKLGHMSPSFPVAAPAKQVADKGKVRLGHMSPSF